MVSISWSQLAGCVNIHCVVLILLSGHYEQLDVSLLPPLWLAYLSDPSDSGELAHTATFSGTAWSRLLHDRAADLFVSKNFDFPPAVFENNY